MIEMADWNGLSLYNTNDLLKIDRMIAERLGYTIYHYDKGYETSCYYMLMDGESNGVVVGREGERKTEDEAWSDCPRFTNRLFLWEHNEVNGAANWWLRQQSGLWSASFGEQLPDERCYYSPALALSIAWLEAQELADQRTVDNDDLETLYTIGDLQNYRVVLRKSDPVFKDRDGYAFRTIAEAREEIDLLERNSIWGVFAMKGIWKDDVRIGHNGYGYLLRPLQIIGEVDNG